MKKFVSIVLTLAMLCALAVPAFAVESAGEGGQTPEELVTEKGGVPGQVNVLWNGTCMKFSDVTPEVKHGRSFVPVRAVMENMDATVEYDHDNKSVSISMGDRDAVVTFVIGSQTATVSSGGEEKEIQMDCASYLKDNSTMVPLRFLSEACGYTVLWDQPCKTAVVVNRDAWAKAADSTLNKFNEMYTATIDEEILEAAQFDTTCTINLSVTNPETGEGIDITPSIKETDYISGMKICSEGSVDLSSLVNTFKEEVPKDVNLGDAVTLLTTDFSAVSYRVLVDETGEIYVNMPLFNSLILHQSENTWIDGGNLAGYGVDMAKAKAPATAGCLIADSILSNKYVQENPIHAYDFMEMVNWMVNAIFDDQRAEDAGDGGYTWTLDGNKLGEALGNKSLDDAFSFSTTLFPDSTGSVTGKINLDTFNGSFRFVNGEDKINLALDVAFEMENIGKVAIDLNSESVITTEGVKLPDFTLPSDAVVVTLDQVMPKVSEVEE